VISPAVEELSLTHPHVVFLKVDVDQNPDISGACNVRSMPTFHFYQKGQLVDQFSGADVSRLQHTVSLYAGAYTEEAKTPKFKSEFFPLVGYLNFGGTDKMDPVLKKAFEFNEQLKSKNVQGFMGDTEVDTLKKVVSIVEDSGRYHVTSFETAELDLIANIVASWPLENKFPILDVLRRLILHPAAAVYYARQYKADSSKGNVIATCNQLLGDGSSNLGTSLMTLRLFANLFQFIEGREIALSPAVALWVLPCLQNFLPHTNQQVHIAAATVLLNYAIAFSQSADSREGKEEVFAIIQEYLAIEKAEEAKLRLVSGLATLVYHDEALKTTLKEKASTLLSGITSEGEPKVTSAIADLKAYLNC